MDKIATANAKEREALFRNTAVKLGISEAVIEKDFWVCYVLNYLFHQCKYKEHFIFKGGTSLSKAYHLIQRFSEDIDLVFDWRLIGYEDSELWEERSNTKQDIFNKEVNARVGAFLEKEVLTILQSELSEALGEVANLSIAEDDPGTIIFAYPRIFADESILRAIRLEIGALAAWSPSENHVITAYVAEQYPQSFANPDVLIPTVSAERTFWEKATILHREACRVNGTMPSRYSRHYYDLYCMGNSPIKETAYQEVDLLEKVVLFKEKFYRCNWARYEEARSGQLKLIPPKQYWRDLEEDYQHMKNMIFGEFPTFAEMMSTMQKMETEMQSL